MADLGDPIALYGDVRCKGGEAFSHGACQKNGEPRASHQNHHWAQVKNTDEHHPCITQCAESNAYRCTHMHGWVNRNYWSQGYGKWVLRYPLK